MGIEQHDLVDTPAYNPLKEPDFSAMPLELKDKMDTALAEVDREKTGEENALAAEQKKGLGANKVDITGDKKAVSSKADISPSMETHEIKDKKKDILFTALQFLSPLKGKNKKQDILQSLQTGTINQTLLQEYAKEKDIRPTVPYRYGVTLDLKNPKKGSDCSGFVTSLCKSFGVTLPRSSIQMYNQVRKQGKVKQPQLGDLVFSKPGNGGKGVNVNHVGFMISYNPTTKTGYMIDASVNEPRGVTIRKVDVGAKPGKYSFYPLPV